MTLYQLDGRHVARRRRYWAHAPVIHAASHFYHAERVAWVSIYMHACDPVPIVMGLRLAARRPLELCYNDLKTSKLTKKYMAISTTCSDSVRMAIHFFVNFGIFKWLYLAYYSVYLYQT